ncbi:MAG: endonuclease/exonuclease/phosphatase family protein [Burkholderiaceae bacterium]|nr:endonuclease/exonuclease/phosphatase family protein [Burkholderiaceae bacterium]
MLLSDPPLLRVLTVNVHKGYTAWRRRFMLHELREAVRTVGSDLVFLQEVSGAPAAGASAHNGVPHPGASMAHYEYLADQIWCEHAYGRNAVIAGRDHGNALLSRFPILGFTNHDVSVPGGEARGLLHCVMRVAGESRPLHGVCVHLGLRESHRQRQLQSLLEMLAREVPDDAPLIVAGDFNDWRGRADAALRGCGLVEVFRLANGHHARSFPARLPLLRLDRIYVRQVKAAHPFPLPRRPWSTLSDHAPLAAEIQL